MAKWRLLALILTIGTFALLAPGSASAFQDPPVKLGTQPQYLPDSTQYVAANSPRTIPGVDPSGTGEDWYAEEFSNSPEFDAAASTELQSESASLLSRTAAWSWDVAPEVTVAAGSLWVGYQIGSKIYGLFSDSGSAPSPGYQSYAYFADHLKLERPGTQLLSDQTGNVYTPSWGVWVHDTHQLAGTETDTHACEYIEWGGGARLYAPGWIPATACGISRYRNYVLFKPGIPVECGLVGDCTGINPVSYGGSNQPTMPTAQQLQDRTQSELNTTNYPVVNDFLNYQEDPRDFPNPLVTKTNWKHACDRSPGAAFMNPDMNLNPDDPFAKYYDTPFSVTNRPAGYETTDVYLRWGSTFWWPGVDPSHLPGGPYVDDWGGWGYRHIKAKHGWSDADLQETEDALVAAVPFQDPNHPDNWDYVLPVSPGVGGVSCARWVAVDFNPGSGEPRGIVTSFNKVGQ
jgi:hypothetical protein